MSMYDQPIIVKKKKAHAHGHHGGSWKVAYADFVTAMMAFFMVMWIMGMSEEDRSVIAAYFNDPVGFAKSDPRSRFNLSPIPGAASMLQMAENQADGGETKMDEERSLKGIEMKLSKAVKADPSVSKLLEQVQVTLTTKGLLIELVERKHSTFFDSGRANLKPAGMQLVRKLGPLIAETGRKVTIEGHTDAVPYGRGDYDNWDLSQDRASTVRRALCANGVSAKVLEGVHGYADTRLKNKANPAASENRRVTILLHFSEAAQGKTIMPADQLKAEFEKKSNLKKESDKGFGH